jgi:acetolactate synthase-1/2/3 large subunit
MDIRVTRDENCYPMIAPGKNNSQMLGLPKKAATAGDVVVKCSNCGTQSDPKHNFCAECGTKL